jgi:hypothetical protein
MVGPTASACLRGLWQRPGNDCSRHDRTDLDNGCCDDRDDCVDDRSSGATYLDDGRHDSAANDRWGPVPDVPH